MARTRVTSFDQDLFQGPEAPVDGRRSASWPADRHGPDPPKAPSRKPSDVDWEVPPLQLPTGTKQKRASSADCGSSSTTIDDPDLFLPLPDDEEQEEEEGSFEEEEDFQLQLTGLDDAAEGAAPASFPRRSSSPHKAMSPRSRAKSLSISPQLGASPMLLSALERVAAEAGTHLSRNRIGTV